jgi:hypothetical protein
MVTNKRNISRTKHGNKNLQNKLLRGVNYSEKSVRRFLGLKNPGNFSRDSGIFSPNLRVLGFFSADFFEIFSLIFFFAELFPTFFATYNPSNYFKMK